MKNTIVVITFLLSGLLSAQKWEANLNDAMAMAKESQNNIILVFSGSDWCAPCIKLDKTVWQSKEFQSYANDHWVLLRADFPRKKNNRLSDQQSALNAILAEKYNKNGHFPLVVIIDPVGNILGQAGYKNVSPKEYIALLKNLQS